MKHINKIPLCLLITAIIILSFTGCNRTIQKQKITTTDSTKITDPVAEINRQIFKYNDERNTGESPIEKRAFRVEYIQEQDIVECLNEEGIEFLTLERQSDGRFKGIIEASWEKSTLERDSWGYILAEFFLPKDAFQQLKTQSK